MKPFKDAQFIDFIFTVLIFVIASAGAWYGIEYIKTNDAHVNLRHSICDKECYPFLYVGRNSRTQECICDTTKILKKRDNNE